MALPYRIHIEAAMATLEAVPDSPIDVSIARRSYAKAMTLAKFGVRSMIEAEALLFELGLVSRDGHDIHRTHAGRAYLQLDLSTACEIAAHKLLDRESSPWLATAVHDTGVVFEYVPDSDLAALRSLVLDPEKREEILLAAERRFDDTRRIEDGVLGEELVVTEFRKRLSRAGRHDLAPRVQRLSMISDQLGYDVRAFTVEGDVRRLEVKSTRLTHRIRVFISRNEVEYGASDDKWYLVVCRINPYQSEVVGFCSCAPLLKLLPSDTQAGRWQIASIVLTDSDLTPGLPCS